MAATDTIRVLTTRRTIALFLIMASLRTPLTLSLSSPKKVRPRIPVLSYHDDWVCVNKPAGMSVHRSENTKRSETVLTKAVKRQLARKVFPVHRLDHRTSGAILFAFDSETCGRLHQALAQGTKDYVALLRGSWKHRANTVTVDTPLCDYKTDIIKTAVTHFQLLATQDNASLVLCQPETGRTHQIRRHAWTLGQPIIGDSRHGDTKVNRWWRTNRNLNRLALHSFSMTLGEIELMAPLSPDLKSVMEQEALWETAVIMEPRLLMDPIDLRGGTHGRHYHKRRQEVEVKETEATSELQ